MWGLVWKGGKSIFLIKLNKPWNSEIMINNYNKKYYGQTADCIVNIATLEIQPFYECSNLT
jgi:hypothetical protein